MPPKKFALNSYDVADKDYFVYKKVLFYDKNGYYRTENNEVQYMFDTTDVEVPDLILTDDWVNFSKDKEYPTGTVIKYKNKEGRLAVFGERWYILVDASDKVPWTSGTWILIDKNEPTFRVKQSKSVRPTKFS